MLTPLNLNSPDAILIELALQCESLNDFCMRLGLSCNGGSKTRARAKLILLNQPLGWLRHPVIPAHSKSRSDIIYAPYQSSDGRLIKAYEARPINRQTLQEEFLGTFSSFSKAQHAIAMACPQRARKRTPDELIDDRIKKNATKESLLKAKTPPPVKKIRLFNDPEILKQVVSKSTSLAQALSFYTNSTTGGNPKTFLKRLAEFNISIAHFRRRNVKIFKSSDEILQLNSGASNQIVRAVLLKENLIPYQCSVKECGQLPMHCGKPLTLQLEHINGNRNDHNLSNLTFLCTSCHSQTETYGGKNARRHSRNPTAPEVEAAANKTPKQTDRIKYESIALKWGKPYFETALLNRSSLALLRQELRCSDENVKRAFGYWGLKYLPLQVNASRCAELFKDELNNRFKNGQSLTSIAKDFNCSDKAIKKRALAVGADLALRAPKFKRRVKG